MIIGSKTPSRFLGGKKFLNERVDIARGGVSTAPQVFAIRGVVAASVGLFGAPVEDWDTAGEDSECEGVLEECPV